MKRLNITIDQLSYDNARVAAFLQGSNISAIIREALGEWFEKHKLLEKKQLLLGKNDIAKIKKVLQRNEFVALATVKKKM